MIMESLQNYITEGIADKFKDAIKFLNNIINHSEVTRKDVVTFELDTKTFGKLKRMSKEVQDRPAIIASPMAPDDMWEIYYIEDGENKYGDQTTIFTYIGHYDCRKTNMGKFEIDKKYQEFVEDYIKKIK